VSQWQEVTKLSVSVPRPEGVTLAYGTAGFRAKASLLPSTFLRMGFLAALRAQQTGQVSGSA
jgi:phosphoacetylglucosamine mutase